MLPGCFDKGQVAIMEVPLQGTGRGGPPRTLVTLLLAGHQAKARLQAPTMVGTRATLRPSLFLLLLKALMSSLLVKTGMLTPVLLMMLPGVYEMNSTRSLCTLRSVAQARVTTPREAAPDLCSDVVVQQELLAADASSWWLLSCQV